MKLKIKIFICAAMLMLNNKAFGEYQFQQGDFGHIAEVYKGRVDELRNYAMYLYIYGLEQGDYERINESRSLYRILVEVMGRTEYAREYFPVVLICSYDQGVKGLRGNISYFEEKFGGVLDDETLGMIKAIKQSLNVIGSIDDHDDGKTKAFRDIDMELREVAIAKLKYANVFVDEAQAFTSDAHLTVLLRRYLEETESILGSDSEWCQYTRFNLAFLAKDVEKMKEIARLLDVGGSSLSSRAVNKVAMYRIASGELQGSTVSKEDILR